MNHHTCHDCRTAIPTGLAHLRSIGLERVALCGHCLDLRRAAAQPIPAPVVPTQRSGGTLSERLAAARVAS